MNQWIDWTQYDQDYMEAEAVTSPGQVPNGKYEVAIKQIDTGFWPNTNDACLKYQLVVLEGEHANALIWKNAGIDKYTKGELEALGFKGIPISQVIPRLNEVIGAKLAVQVKTGKNGYPNTYINKVLSSPLLGAPAPAQAPAPLVAQPTPSPAPAPVAAPTAQPAAASGVPF